jgi:hypothetical protein
MRLSSIVAFAFLALCGPSSLQARPPVAAPIQTTGECGIDYYRNISGRCIHRPVQSSTVPAGATARCRDDSYSFSQHRSGTCSHHGGIVQWL